MKPVLVTTKHRGVFGGLVEDDADTKDATVLELKKARMAIRWGTTEGVAQLAATGPTASTKLGAAADVTARDITAVWTITDEAWKGWTQS